MKKLLALILALVMCFSLVACGGDKKDEAKDETKPSESKPAENKPGSGEANKPTGNTAPPSEEVKWKKEIIITEASTTFEKPDPQSDSSLTNTKHYLLSHDRLVYRNPETNEIEPMLATKWDVSADSLTYTFYLRDDVVFHNGEKMTADDVVFTMERGRQSANGQVKNHYSYVTYEAVDDYTVKAVLETPNADFLLTRAISFMGIVNREACEADELEGSWIGTGLWILDDYRGQEGCTWVRNDNYWGETTPTERIVFRHIPEGATRLISVENGEVDVSRSIPSMSAADVRDNDDLQLIEVVSTMCSYIGFNNDKEGPWNDINFRKAMAYALDYDAIIQGVYNGNGEQAKTFWGYKDMYGYAPPAEGYSQNIELAKEYLAKSSYKGETIELLCNMATWGKIGVIVSDMCAKVGINIESVQLDNIAYTPRVTAGDYEMNCFTYSMPVFGSGVNNWAISGNGVHCLVPTNDAIPDYERITKLMADGLTTTDDAARKAIYAELQELWMDNLVNIPLLHSYNYGAAAKGFEGTIYVGSEEHDYRYIRIPEA